MLIMDLLRRMRRRKRSPEFLTPSDMERNGAWLGQAVSFGDSNRPRPRQYRDSQ